MAGTTDTVKAMLTPGEFVIRKEAVDMIGVPILEKLNDMPEAGGHSEIDRLIAMATLKNMTGMYGGGNVEAYGHGGKVHGALKPVPNNNPGLAKLPEKVRNKMGYMQDGGEVSPEMLMDLARIKNLNYTQPSFRFPIMESLNNLDLSDAYMDSVRSGGNTEMFDRLRSLASSFGQKNDSSEERYKPLSDEEILDFYNQLKKSSMMESKEDSLMGMMYGGKAKKKKKYGYQEGGAVQDSSMMRQPNPFVPFDQRPPSSGEVMSPIPRGMEQGDYYRSLRNELEMENKELVRDKVQNTLDRIALDSLLNQGAEYIERRPDDSLSFPNTPEQDYFMKKYREQMIDPMFLPQDN